MTLEEKMAIKCAFADLCGAMQAYLQSDIHAHDWKAHAQTLHEMLDVFDFLDPLPADLMDYNEGETK